MSAPSNERCQLHVYDDYGNSTTCNALAVVIWESRDANLPVCEQCEAMILDLAKDADGVPIFSPI